MTLQQGLAFGLMAATVAAFIWGKLRYDLIALTALVAGALMGVVPVETMFSGFSNDLIWIIASALLLSAAIARSGLVERVLGPVLRLTPNTSSQVAAFAGATMLLSMVTKNIGALAILMPVALQHGKKTNVSPSRVLMPMAFASLLGGLVTLVGTSPNVIVSSVRESLLGEPYKLFDFAPVGLGVCLAGFAFLAVAQAFIKIERSPPPGVEAALEGAPYTTEFTVAADAPVIGQTFQQLFADRDDTCRFVSGICKAKGEKIALQQLVGADDRLIVEGDQADLEKFAAAFGLQLAGERHREEAPGDKERVVEGVVSGDSPLRGQSAASARLYERYGLSLLAVRRQGASIAKELRSVRLKAGDVILLKADEEHIGAALSELGVMPLSQRNLSLGVKRFGYAPVILLGLAIIAVGMGLAPIHLAFPAAAVGVLLLRVMSMSEAYAAVDGSLFVLLAALIPISESISQTGGDKLIAAALSGLIGPLPPFLAVASLIIVGMVVTPFLNNAATILILAPIAAATATALGVKPDPYLMAIAIGAACDFLTPIGHQCNTLVMGPGGYRFSDYWRLGLPLSVIVVLVATPLIIMVWN